YPWNALGNLLQYHLNRYEEAEQAYRRAIELNFQFTYSWSNLGRLLELHFDRAREAGEAYLRAFEIDTTRLSDLTSFVGICARLAESPDELPCLLTMLQKAHELAPDHREIQFLLAQVLTLTGKWAEASQLLRQLATNELAFFSTGFFRVVVKKDHIEEAIAVLEQTGANERWWPLYESMQAANAGTPYYLRTVAPEVRTVAEQILRQINPELFTAGGRDH
ncbi:MAG TPA: tetratricopeptide repeat protein, partial [Candidatus Angelobacter sp.]|nr:tetratricopeptide repeat protein [Candidatus Angelobacter sp.]